jgi:hypothetical protein
MCGAVPPLSLYAFMAWEGTTVLFLPLSCHKASIGILLFHLLVVQYPHSVLGPHTVEVSRSHSQTRQSVRFLWTGDQPEAETST